MSYTKPKIYNLALSALMLVKEVAEIETDKSNEVRVLNMHWDIALESTLKDLNLDSLSTPIELELIEELDIGPWKYVYKYPTNCAFLRRIKSCAVTDTARTHIPKRIAMHVGQKAIFTNEFEAVGECLPKNIPLASLESMAGLALAYKLAMLSAPLITGKGAKTLLDQIEKMYIIAKHEAQESDTAENMNYDPDYIRSEFVAARLE
jgi:hypothetical protein